MSSETTEDKVTPTEEPKTEDKDVKKEVAADEVVKDELVATEAIGKAVEGDAEKPAKDLDVKDESTENGDEIAPTLVETPKSEGDDKLMKELDDEAPKTFPQVLMDILSSEEDSDTISWLPHGRSFIIYKKKKFASQVLPKFFKATKFTSFTRKLNRWGFTRVTRGPEMGSYYHKLFLREDPGMCLRMSSHSSSKFNEQQQLMPAPMAPMPFGMGVPFGMPGMAPGMQPMMSGAMPGMNPGDLSQQNQFINQQLQQLQWQQFQLQQLQQQQHHAQQQGHGPPPPGHGPPMHHHQHPSHMAPPGHGPPHPGHGLPPPQHGGGPPMGPPQQGPPPSIGGPPPGAPIGPQGKEV